MGLNFRFAVVSDLHIGLQHTILEQPNRFHLVEVSIPALEIVLDHLEQLNLDFLLLPGDLTQDGEIDNHDWLAKRLSKLPFPTYVVPGNHDIVQPQSDGYTIGLADFPHYYHQFGYTNLERLYYTCEVLPGVRLIGLNSIQFNSAGRQLGQLDEVQLAWLKDILAEVKGEVVLVMIHHNVIEHLPNQSNHVLGRRYMLDNAPVLLDLLHQAGVQLIFTGHLHVQDLAQFKDIWEITTGSLVSFPHPYRVLEFSTDELEHPCLQVKSYRVTGVPGWPPLSSVSREWMANRSFPFMVKLLSEPPLSLPRSQAEALAPDLRHFWADIAGGDAVFDFPQFPPAVRHYFQSFSAGDYLDNQVTLTLK